MSLREIEERFEVRPGSRKSGAGFVNDPLTVSQVGTVLVHVGMHSE